MKLSIPTTIYKSLVIFLCGVILGIFIAVKYLVPDGTDIHIGKIKVRGNGNSTNVENIVNKKR